MINKERQIVGELLTSFDAMLDEVLAEHNLNLTDKVVSDFRDEVLNTPRNLGDDAVMRHSVKVSSEIYRLSTLLGKQGLRASITKVYHSQKESQSFVSAVLDENGKKLTIGDKTALSNLDTEAEQQIKELYASAMKSIEQRMWSLRDIKDTINLINYQNQSDKRLGGHE